MVPMLVRRATPDEVVDLRLAVLRPGGTREDAVWDGDHERETRHWVVERGERIVGVATVLQRPYPDGAGPEWQLRGMAVAAEERGTGLGRALLDALVREVAAPLWCNARVTAIAFYERAGWRVTSEPFDTAVGPHRRMRVDAPG
jgi:GNAT superfamily N-acetyltransferase